MEIVAKGSDLSQRKLMLKLGTNGYIVLPGGFGTWDEMWDIIGQNSVGLNTNDIIIVNTNGYYNGFKLQIETAFNNGMIPSIDSVKFVNSVDDINFRFEKCS